ncbi:MAG: SDR family NAD(P)-dependent oxidoreductase [Bacteroidetes bacterium]|nr:MAG: SDR family NAD(P)-dependent oxidoreductase [Bacteroidota bacterium]
MKKAIVVGATSGIGREIARMLAEEGCCVGITGRRESLLRELEQENPEKFIVKAFDATLTEENSRHLDELCEALGGFDLMVISSGTGELNETFDFSLDKPTIDLNVAAFTNVADWAMRYFQNKGSGHLVAITSVAGVRGARGAAVYNASKAYQIHFLEGIRHAVTKDQLPIVVTDVRAGFVDTAMMKGDGHFWVSTPQKAARQIMDAIRKKASVVYVSRRWRLIAGLLRILPAALYYRT